jgi:hypothetical protein
MTDFICTFSDEALCLQDAQLKRAISQPGPLFVAKVTGGEERVLITVRVRRNSKDLDPKQYWACRMTGTLFDMTTGQSLSSSRIRLAESPRPVLRGEKLPSRDKQKSVPFRIVRKAA